MDKKTQLVHTAIMMSERLMGLIQGYLVKNDAGMARLAVAVGMHQGTVQRWIKEGRIPNSHSRYLVALACGCSEQDAASLAGDCSSELAKETA